MKLEKRKSIFFFFLEIHNVTFSAGLLRSIAYIIFYSKPS